MSEEKVIAVSGAITEAARDELSRIAAAEDRTFSYVLRRFIEEGLARRAKLERRKAKKQRATA